MKKNFSNEERKEIERLCISIGKRIRELREKKGVSQTDLAHTMNRDSQVVHRLETGKNNVTIGLLKLVAEALEVNIKDLL